MADLPEHSPLGGSGAERWMNCPGSQVILNALDLPPSDESEYSIEGSGAHEAAAKCVVERLDAWEVVGEKFYKGVEVTPAMASHLQPYIDRCREDQDEPGSTCGVEYKIAGDFHPLFYGRIDFFQYKLPLLKVRDFKYGAGLAVDATDNAQLKYYAYGLLQDFPDARDIELEIVQPRAYHPEGTVRTWRTSAEELAEWGEKKLIPAMHAAEVDHELKPGEWCRFCPAKLACPMLTALYKAAANANPHNVKYMTDEEAGENYRLRAAVKHYMKAQEEDMMRRLLKRPEQTHTKLVYQKADRVWKDGAEEALARGAGLMYDRADLYSKPKLLSPAKVEELGAKAKKLVKEWAYTPQRGFTVALVEDKRMGVKPQAMKDVFAEELAALDRETKVE